MGMEKTLVNSTLLTIFVVAIITFAVQFGIDNNSDVVITDDSRYTSLNSSLRGDLENLSSDSSSSKDILLKTTLESGDEHAGSGGQFKVGPFTAIGMTIRSMGTGFNSIFGEDSAFGFILVAFVTLFTFLVGYYVIKAWLGRDPD